MKKENKYYIPTIEEFHIGFEYEEEVDISPDPPEFVKKVFSKNDSLYNMQDKIRVETVKVKFIDKEDFEGLGFVYKEGEDSMFGKLTGYIKFEEVGFNTGIVLKIQEVKGLMFGCPPIFDVFLDTFGSYDTSTNHFRFFIKNKSELKKFLENLSL